jgi:type III secretion protein Q
MGYVDLFQDEIAQVGPGDILVTQRSGAALFPNNFSKGWTLIPDESNSTVFKVDKYFERSMPVELGGEALADSLRPDIQALPLRLHVVLGEKDFTLAQLQSLSPGTIVELEVAKSDPVRLMVNGKILGEGELVDVDGNLAVKVLRWRTG